MKSSNTVWHHATVSRARREQLNGHRGAVIWFTGLSGSGKSTLSHAVEERLHQAECHTFVLDGDNIRHGLCADLSFSNIARAENIRRVGEVAKLFVEAGTIVLTAFISPFESDRERVKALLSPGDFIEIYCRCPLEICEERDTKGLYKRARAGEIEEFTGISSPYDVPVNPAITIDTELLNLEECVELVLNLMHDFNVIGLGNQ
jgi:adenylylsulfate kinase